MVGGVQKSGNAKFSPSPVTGAASFGDPLASLPVPSASGTAASVNLSGNSSQTINPGIYSQITVSGNGKLTMNPGIYVIAGGGFSVTGNGCVSGSGVMIYNAGSNYLGTGNLRRREPQRQRQHQPDAADHAAPTPASSSSSPATTPAPSRSAATASPCPAA